MPSVSKKQHNLMEAVANSPAFAKKVGIKQSVGKDFAAADKGKKFKGGGMALFKGKETYGEELKEAKSLKSGKISPAGFVKGEQKEEKKMAKGGMAKESMGSDVETGSNKLTKFGESAIQKKGKTKGKNLGDSGPTKFSRGGGIESKGKTKGRFI
jgi:hypothetical protein